MAEPKDKASAAGENKTTGRSGAVKPPVLEGTARPADSAKPEASSKASAPFGPEKPKTESPKPGTARPEAAATASPAGVAPAAARTESRAGTAWLAGLAGGALGLGAAYGLALAGYWPAQEVPPPPPDPRIASVSSAVPELQTIASTLQDELATLTTRVAELESGDGARPAETGDPARIEQLAGDIAALGARIDELAAAPQAESESLAANEARIAALEADLAALQQTSAEAQAELGNIGEQVTRIEADVSAGTEAEQGQARLPLIVSGLEAAFATGAPYDAEITALRQALPDLAIAEPVLGNAMTGLKRPDLIARDFNAVLPDILAGRPVSPDASWQETASDWFRGIIALRPTEAVEGDTPEAIVARLEAAIGRGDFAAARAEFEALPEPMRAAAGSLAQDIASQAEARAFLTQLRQSALAVENGA